MSIVFVISRIIKTLVNKIVHFIERVLISSDVVTPNQSIATLLSGPKNSLSDLNTHILTYLGARPGYSSQEVKDLDTTTA